MTLIRIAATLAAMSAAALAGAARAQDPQAASYSFVGIVTASSGPGAPAVGTEVPIAMSADRSVPYSSRGWGTVTYSGGIDSGTPAPITAASFGGMAVAGGTNEILVSKGAEAPGSRDRFSGYELVTQVFRRSTMEVTFRTTIPGVVGTRAIPKSILPGDFQAGTFQYESFDPAVGQVYVAGTIEGTGRIASPN